MIKIIPLFLLLTFIDRLYSKEVDIKLLNDDLTVLGLIDESKSLMYLLSEFKKSEIDVGKPIFGEYEVKYGDSLNQKNLFSKLKFTKDGFKFGILEGKLNGILYIHDEVHKMAGYKFPLKYPSIWGVIVKDDESDLTVMSVADFNDKDHKLNVYYLHKL